MNINDFPVKKELKHEIAELMVAYMAALGIDVSHKKQQEFQDKHSEDLIESVLEAIAGWQQRDEPAIRQKCMTAFGDKFGYVDNKLSEREMFIVDYFVNQPK